MVTWRKWPACRVARPGQGQGEFLAFLAFLALELYTMWGDRGSITPDLTNARARQPDAETDPTALSPWILIPPELTGTE